MATSLRNVPLKVIENFTLEEVIGEGSFGTVYLASNGKSKVAIKEVRLTNISDQRYRCAMNEIEIHQSLDHPSIVKCFDTIITEEYAYLVTELCKTDLGSMLKNKKEFFTFQQIKKMMIQIVNGLIYLKEEHGVIHRDLKVSNLLLDERNNIKIADFGMAVYVLPKTQHRTVCGTIGFVAREVLEREPQGFGSDLWSLGCVLYTMFVGHSPFESGEQKKTINNVINVQFNFPTQMPDAAKDLIGSLLHKNPEKRIKLHDVLRHDFLINNYKKQFQGISLTNSSIKSESQSFNHDSLPLMVQGFDAQQRLHRQMSADNLAEGSRMQHSMSSRHNLLPDRGKPPSAFAKHRPQQYLQTGSLQNPNFCDSAFDSGISPSEPTDSKKLLVSNLINCKRLKYMRRSLKYGMFTIMKRIDDGTNEVYFEPWLHESDKKRVNHLLKISEDGMKITSYVFHEPRLILPDRPVDVPFDHKSKEFLFDEYLPNKIRRFYNYILDYVNMARSLTPKVTHYNDENGTVCWLMENLDFKAQFVDGVEVMKKMGGAAWKLRHPTAEDWTGVTKDHYRKVSNLSQKMEYAQRRYGFVATQERSYSLDNCENFPVRLGSKQLCDQFRERFKTLSVNSNSRSNDSGFQSNRSNMSANSSNDTKHHVTSSYR